jgi:hypothetical protein
LRRRLPRNRPATAVMVVVKPGQGPGRLAELTVDDGRRGATKDIRPSLPLVIHR